MLPGISSYKTIMANHCSEFVGSPNARAGNLLDNPIHKDMLYAAKTAGLKFIINVVLNGEKEIIGSFAGDLEAAHAKGIQFLSSLARVNKIDSDIAVATNGGYPLDQNIYQAVKGMSSAEATNKEGGVIIMVAGLADGHGGLGFYNNLAQTQSKTKLAIQQTGGFPIERVQKLYCAAQDSSFLTNPRKKFFSVSVKSL